MIHYHEVTDPELLKVVVDLEIKVWAMDDPTDAVPHNMMIALIHAGGMVHGAFDTDRNDEMLGFSLMFPARFGDEWGLWSHMAGVLPGNQSRGIGRGLKLAQRDWALTRGYTLIGWTFDPLQRGNANFNLRLLGAHGAAYLVNVYGTMNDSINRGMESDRIEALWRLDDPQVAALARGAAAPDAPDAAAMIELVDHVPQLAHVSPLGQPHISIQIPDDISSLKRQKPALARAWQLAVRASMRAAFDAGYQAVNFTHQPGRAQYLMQLNAKR